MPRSSRRWRIRPRTPQRPGLLVDPVRTVGRFHESLGSFLNALYLSRDNRWTWRNKSNTLEQEIEAEAFAQIQSLQAQGIHLTHIDTHKHTHMSPASCAQSCAQPKPPASSPSVTPTSQPGASPPLPAPQACAASRSIYSAGWTPTFRRIVQEEGFRTTDGAIGVLATGTLDSPTINSLLAAMPNGTWELVTHPAYNDAALANAGTRLLASREIERTALLNAKFPPDIHRIHFGDL